jgi:hypothetical protein
MKACELHVSAHQQPVIQTTMRIEGRELRVVGETGDIVGKISQN